MNLHANASQVRGYTKGRSVSIDDFGIRLDYRKGFEGFEAPLREPSNESVKDPPLGEALEQSFREPLAEPLKEVLREFLKA